MLAAIVGIKIVLGWTLSKEVNRHQDIAGRWDEEKKGASSDQQRRQQ